MYSTKATSTTHSIAISYTRKATKTTCTVIIHIIYYKNLFFISKLKFNFFKFQRIPEKRVTLPGRVLPPPPRQIIVERMPVIPPKPRDLIIERWLGYKRRIRKVEFKPASPPILAPKPNNIIIEWDSPNVTITKNYVNLGMHVADPQAYLAAYGSHLTDSSQLPEEASHVKPPVGEVLAAFSNSNLPPIYVGDVLALKLFNLECH